MLAKMRRPSTTPSAIAPRLFSSRTTSAASLATSTADSTEMPTSARWSATASLTPSPRNATSSPLRCAAATSAAFCSGPDPREDRRPRDQLRQLLVGEPREVGAAGDALDLEPDLVADVHGGALVVAGQHLELDARGAAAARSTRRRPPSAGRRRRGSRAARVVLVVGRVAGLRLDRPLGKRQHAVSVVEQPRERLLDLSALPGDRLGACLEAYRAAAGEHLFGGSLAEQAPRPSRSRTTDVRRRSNVNGSVATTPARASSASATFGSRLRQIARSSVFPSGVPPCSKSSSLQKSPCRLRSCLTAPVGPTASR